MHVIDGSGKTNLKVQRIEKHQNGHAKKSIISRAKKNLRMNGKAQTKRTSLHKKKKKEERYMSL